MHLGRSTLPGLRYYVEQREPPKPPEPGGRRRVKPPEQRLQAPRITHLVAGVSPNLFRPFQKRARCSRLGAMGSFPFRVELGRRTTLAGRFQACLSVLLMLASVVAFQAQFGRVQPRSIGRVLCQVVDDVTRKTLPTPQPHARKSRGASTDVLYILADSGGLLPSHSAAACPRRVFRPAPGWQAL